MSLQYDLTSEQQISRYKTLKEKVNAFKFSVKECSNIIKLRKEEIEEINAKKTLIFEEKNTIQNDKTYRRAKFAVNGAKGYFFIFYNVLLTLLLLENHFNGKLSNMVFSFLKINLNNIASVMFRFSLYGICLYILWRIFHINCLFRRSEKKEAKPLFAKIAELEKNIELCDKQIQSIKEDIKQYEENISNTKELSYIISEETVNLFVEELKARLMEKKIGGKNYEDLYPWIDHLYDIGYEEAVKYEVILLYCEKEVWVTPDERKEYCERRIEEVGGYKYIPEAVKYAMKYYTTGLNIGGATTQNDSSSDLTDADAWHAVSSGMMGGNGIDSTGM